MSPVLFLDIDGVILPGWFWRDEVTRKARKLRQGYLFPAEIMARLNKVAAETGALVCVSSSWRYDERFRDLFAAAGFAGAYHADWRTCTVATNLNGVYLGRTRGEEIAAWLDRHPEVKRWAIVDDEADMLPCQAERFVRTDFEIGLTYEAANKLQEMLS